MYIRAFLLAALPCICAPLDLRQLSIVAPPETRLAANLLIDEIESRTRLRLPLADSPAGSICLSIARQKPAEGFRIATYPGAPCLITLNGNDTRGILFAAGRLLRELAASPGALSLPEPLNLTTAPKYPVRGHQIGYRNANNTYDAWSVADYRQYILDMAVFGANTVEVTGTGMDRGDRSPHFRLPPLRMHQEISRITKEYGLDFSIWLPATQKSYEDPNTAARELAEWERAFRAIPHLNAVFVPGGDPGHTEPRILMPFLEKAAAVLKKVHPNAGIWVSPQGMDDAWLAQFYAELNKRPQWLAGVVHGPWVRPTMTAFRKAVPAEIAIRLYPDITHTLRCQNPMPNWDPAFAITHGREPINPLPVAQTAWFGRYAPGSIGFVSYSDGANDDFNKVLWTALAWDPGLNPLTVQRQYARHFIGIEPLADVLSALERNWHGPLSANPSPEQALTQAQTLEQNATPQQKRNWRFQQLLYRAYYDAYTQRRLAHETSLEIKAREHLAAASKAGSLPAIDSAAKALAGPPSAPALRARIGELAEALFQSLGAQFSVAKYQASGWERGATLDTVDAPLNSRDWLLSRFAEIRKLPAESDRLREIEAILHREDPGPGGFYDDLGDPSRQPHFVPDGETGQQGFLETLPGPKAWKSHANSWRGRPIRMRYTGLDPAARYKVRVVYGGEAVAQEQGIRLTANGAIEVHPYLPKPLPIRPVEFEIPAAATKSGTLELTWDRQEPPSGRLRGAQVSEVWLIRQP